MDDKRKRKPKTWIDIFDASLDRGDDPFYAMWLADEWEKRQERDVTKLQRPAVREEKDDVPDVV